jgi:hypothetical protein
MGGVEGGVREGVKQSIRLPPSGRGYLLSLKLVSLIVLERNRFSRTASQFCGCQCLVYAFEQAYDRCLTRQRFVPRPVRFPPICAP